MATRTFALEVVTPDRTVFSGEAASLVAPGSEGYFGVMADHAPMVAGLAAGVIKLKEGTGKETVMAVGGGFFEVAANHAIMLADTAELAGEIDRGRAEAALQRARTRLTGGEPGADRTRARAALTRAEARLKAAVFSQ